MEDDYYTREDQERYIIGFTENQYHPSSDSSPTPTDHIFRYSSPALDYAERSNKGAENIYLDHSELLDKQRNKSVHKINYNILDLMFELSERRKSTTTPLLSRSFKSDYKRSDSRVSECSLDSIKTSSSLPLIEVQQLPPIPKPSISLPSLNLENSGIMTKRKNQSMARHEAKNQEKKDNDKSDAKSKKSSQNKNEEIDKTTKTKTDTRKEPRMVEIVRKVQELHRGSAAAKENIENPSAEGKDIGKTEIVSSSNGEKNDAPSVPQSRHINNRWTNTVGKLVDVTKRVRDDRDNMSSYKGRYHNLGDKKHKFKMSFCQSSYKERAEKDRIDNIRRRHVTQTRTEPVDFNKLRRQIIAGRSNTLLW